MGMPIDKPWGKVFALQIHHLLSLAITAYAGNPPIIYGYTALLYLTSKGIYDFGVGEEQISRRFSLGHRDQGP